MRRTAVKVGLLGLVMALMVMGCATSAPKYSSYSTEQLRQEMAIQKAKYLESTQAITDQKQDYRDSVNNHPTFGTTYGAGAVGTIGVLGNSLAARAAAKRIEDIQFELVRRGTWCPDDIKYNP